jgi:hypothetical protein
MNWAGKEYSIMSDMNIERPEADSVEQDRDALLGTSGSESRPQSEVPFEADAADAADQDREVGSDDDEYR